jgi:hypothetical protein
MKNMPMLVISREEAVALKEEAFSMALGGFLSVAGYDDVIESINRRTVPS